MEENTKNTLLKSVRAIGSVKPSFDHHTQSFFPPQLTVLGTGFWVKNNVFITCAHVVQKFAEQHIDIAGALFFGGNEDIYRKASISILDYEHDLAVLCVEEKNFKLENERISLNITNKKEKIGEDVFFAGYPLGDRLLNDKHTTIFSKGCVAHASSDLNIIRKHIKISGSIEPGFSGSPVVNKEGEVFGVVANHPLETKNIFNIISWEHVQKIIDLEQS